jgi:hypothetical protein
MQTIATFFTGIMLFFSGLFGHQVQAPITQNVSVNSETLSTQEIKNPGLTPQGIRRNAKHCSSQTA